MKSVAWKALSISAAICSFVIVGTAQQKPADANDPRVGLKPGVKDAGVAARGLELVATRFRPDGFFDPENPAGLAMPGETPANAQAPMQRQSR